MAGNYNYDSLMSRNQFYDEYAPISLMASNARRFPDFKDSYLFTSPGYRDQSLNRRGDGRFYDDFNQAYGRYTNLFNGRKTAAANAEAARSAAIKQQ